MEGLDVDDVFQHCRLNPTEVDAVTYYLPRLLSGETLHGVEKFIHSVEISGCEPKDLAARHAACAAVRSGDGSSSPRARARTGANSSVKPAALDHPRPRRSATREARSARSRTVVQKEGQVHRWVMEEYRCLLEATIAEGEGVLQMHLAQHAPPPPRIGAYMLQESQRGGSRACSREERHCRRRSSSAAQEKDARCHHPSPLHRFSCRMSQYRRRQTTWSCSLAQWKIFSAASRRNSRVGATENISPPVKRTSTASPLNRRGAAVPTDEVAAEHEPRPSLKRVAGARRREGWGGIWL
ncbi:hypothetical protein ZWY2020_049292 [Hordeum vulgare]|nr:hypothetical protein ZWY2020_049292 [Hordeum vulgare]